MTQEFKYTHDKQKGVISVITPYDPKFVNKARNLRGKWEDGAWHFDDGIEEYVKAALLDCYGTTGQEPVDYVDLLISNFDWSGRCSGVSLFGRTIAIAFGRDSGARLGDDIIWLDGKYTSGGSVKNWTTDVIDGSFIIKNFPLPRTEFEDIQEAIKDGWCEIKKQTKKRTREEIQADIDKYTAILDALKTELNNIKETKNDNSKVL